MARFAKRLEQGMGSIQADKLPMHKSVAVIMSQSLSKNLLYLLISA